MALFIKYGSRLLLVLIIVYAAVNFVINLNRLVASRRPVVATVGNEAEEKPITRLERPSDLPTAGDENPQQQVQPTLAEDNSYPKPLLPEGRLFVVVLVLSESPDAPRRTAIRDSWARPIGVYNIDHAQLATKVNKRGDGNFDVANVYRHYFVVGRLAGLLDYVRQEMEKEKDVVMVDENDYASTSVKLYWAFLWALSNLQFEYVVKAQDTAFINVPSMVSWLCLQPPTRFYGGHIVHLARIIKRKRSPWYMAESFYRGKFYPDYLLSFAFVLSHDMARLVTDVWRTRLVGDGQGLLHIDDLDVGLTMRNHSVPPLHVQRFYKGFTNGLCRDKQMVVIADVPRDKLQTLGDNMKRTGYPTC